MLYLSSQYLAGHTVNKTVTNPHTDKNQCSSWEGGCKASRHCDCNAVLTIEDVDDQLFKHRVAVHDWSPLKGYLSTLINN